jgi:hypothetical protein
MLLIRTTALCCALVPLALVVVAPPEAALPGKVRVEPSSDFDSTFAGLDPRHHAFLRANPGSRDRVDPLDLGERRSRAGQENEDKAPNVEVNYLKDKDEGWSLAETTNFRIFHKHDQKVVEQVAKTLEWSRVRAYRKWVGDVESDWRPKCYVYLDDAKGELSKNLHGVRGYTRKGGLGGTVRRYVRVRSRDDGLISSVIPHEVTHAVMFGEFGENEAPSWAHEGMAVMMQPHIDRDRFFDVLLRAYKKNGLFYVGKILDVEDYPNDDVDIFYAESVSLVDYLTSLRKPAVFVTFIRDALKRGYDKALQEHYEIPTVAELEKRWKARTFGEGQVPPKGFTLRSEGRELELSKSRN